MNIYEHLLPGKENALTPEYLATKYHFSSVRMLQKQIEAERKAGKVILSSTTPPGGYYLPAAGDTMEGMDRMISVMDVLMIFFGGFISAKVCDSIRELERGE